jgi:hypothetical protein
MVCTSAMMSIVVGWSLQIYTAKEWGEGGGEG